MKRPKVVTDIFDPSSLVDSDYHLLDASGLICPEPVMLLHNCMRSMESGDIVKVCATDPSTERDILRFCDFLNHPLLHWQKEADNYEYWIKKK